MREQLENRDQIYISKYEKSVAGISEFAPEGLKEGDLVLIKQRKAGGLRLPLMGPFRFIKYRGQKKAFATVENILNGKEISVTTPHLVHFNAELSPALIS